MSVNFERAILFFCTFSLRLAIGYECHREKQFEKVEPDGLAQINPIEVTTAIERTFCSMNCLDYKGCNSFAYLNNTPTENCLLSSNADGASVSGANGVAEIYTKAEPDVHKGCQPNPCLSGGTCIDTCEEPFYLCVCPEGTTGQVCKPIFHPFNARFTNLGASGRSGPTTIGSHYNGKPHETLTTVQNGIQFFTVPYAGVYTITAVGAGGGLDKSKSSYRGRGARVGGNFNLEKGQVLKILVGQLGADNIPYSSAGGGGGTFVATSSNTPLIVGGGGGGTESVTTAYGNSHGSMNENGKPNCGSSWSGGTNGNGASEADASNSGGGGGGFFTSGRSSKQFGGSMGTGGEGGSGFIQGGQGGRSYRNSAVGGFGGGGGAYGNGGGAGGGGGYSGGACGNNIVNSCGGGGGSFNGAFENKFQSHGYNSDHGYVIIERILL